MSGAHKQQPPKMPRQARAPERQLHQNESVNRTRATWLKSYDYSLNPNPGPEFRKSVHANTSTSQNSTSEANAGSPSLLHQKKHSVSLRVSTASKWVEPLKKAIVRHP